MAADQKRQFVTLHMQPLNGHELVQQYTAGYDHSIKYLTFLAFVYSCTRSYVGLVQFEVSMLRCLCSLQCPV